MYSRPRRNRATAAIRAMVQETRLDTANLIYPLFMEDGKNVKTRLINDTIRDDSRN